MSVQKPTTLAEAMASYGLNSVERFPSFDPSINEKRTGTTFYGDFKVAEAGSRNGGLASLKETWSRVWKEWRNNTAYMIELCLVMNHLCWEHDEKGNMEWSAWYGDRYHETFDRIFSSGTEEEPLPDGCTPFTEADHTLAFNVLD